MNHKKIVVLLLAVCMLAISVCLERSVFAVETTLVLYSQEDCIHPDVLEAFTHETGVPVEYTILEPESSTERFTAAPEQALCDVLLADVEQLSQLHKQQCLTQLDDELLPNQAGIDPVFYSVPFIRDSKTSVPCLWTTMGLIYDPSLTENRVTGWSNLFQVEFSGRVIMPEDSREAYAIALTALGFDANTNQPDEIAAAGDYLSQQMPLVMDYCSISSLEFHLSANPQLIAPCYGADAIELMASAADLSFVVPSEGSWRKVLAYAIPSGTQDQELAHLLIDYLCQPEVLARNAAYSGYSTVSADAYQLLDHSWQVNPLAYPTGSDWSAYSLLDSQDSQIQTDCQVRWHQLRDSWQEYHWEY